MRRSDLFLAAAGIALLASVAPPWGLTATAQTVAVNRQQPLESASPGAPPPPSAPFWLGVTGITVTPQAGMILFAGNERFTTGIAARFDFFRSHTSIVGLSAAGLYSGLNNTLSGASGFFSGFSFSNRTYIFQLPLDLTLTLFPERLGRWRPMAHFGANFIYSSAGVGTTFGSTPIALPPGDGQGAIWNAWPDMGVDVIYSTSSILDIDVRYDASILGAFTLHTLSLGLGYQFE